MLDFPCVIAHGGKIGPRTMRTKLNNNNTHNAEMHMKEKVEEITLLCLFKASASTPNLLGGMKQKRPRQKNV
jgi:hypothetical protein